MISGSNREGGGGTSKSWGTNGSGKSMSNSGSVESPTARSEAVVTTPPSDKTFIRLNHLDNHADDAGSQGTDV